MQVRSAFNGGHMQNQTAHFLAEYVTRKRLAKLGYTSPIGELDSLKVEAFCLIDVEIDDLSSKELKKANGKR